MNHNRFPERHRFGLWPSILEPSRGILCGCCFVLAVVGSCAASRSYPAELLQRLRTEEPHSVAEQCLCAHLSMHDAIYSANQLRRSDGGFDRCRLGQRTVQAICWWGCRGQSSHHSFERLSQSTAQCAASVNCSVRCLSQLLSALPQSTAQCITYSALRILCMCRTAAKPSMGSLRSWQRLAHPIRPTQTHCGELTSR